MSNRNNRYETTWLDPALWRAAVHRADVEAGLCPYQATRVAALRAAREVLVAKNALGFAAPDPIDLIAVASWIVDGQDPYAAAVAAAA